MQCNHSLRPRNLLLIGLICLLAEHAHHAAESSPWLYGFSIDVPLDYGQRRQSRANLAEGVVLLARCDLADALWILRSGLRSDLTRGTTRRA